MQWRCVRSCGPRSVTPTHVKVTPLAFNDMESDPCEFRVQIYALPKRAPPLPLNSPHQYSDARFPAADKVLISVTSSPGYNESAVRMMKRIMSKIILMKLRFLNVRLFSDPGSLFWAALPLALSSWD